jgi:hypothetical protein
MKRLMLAGFAVLVATTLPALEVQEGRLRLRLHEDTARFSLYLDTGDRWVPLLFPDDPRTTALDIVEGNRVHRMGDSGNFRQITERFQGGARFVWTSPTLRVEQSFRVHSRNRRASDGCGTHAGRGGEPKRTARAYGSTYPVRHLSGRSAAHAFGSLNRTSVCSRDAVDSRFRDQVHCECSWAGGQLRSPDHAPRRRRHAPRQCGARQLEAPRRFGHGTTR